MDRRDVLRGLASGAAAPLLGSLFPAELLSWGREVHLAVAANQSAAGSLPAEIVQTLTAACERIIPADETPGAIAAGVPAFIDHMLSDWYDPPERARVLPGSSSMQGRRASAGRLRPARAPNRTRCSSSSTRRTGALVRHGEVPDHLGLLHLRDRRRPELGQWPSPGRYDGCAPYSPRPRKARVQR